MERPNTVAGLIAKRSEIAAYRKQLEAELRKVVCDLDHLDAAIRLFDGQTRSVKRYITRHRAKRGEMRRFVLGRLREAVEPLTSRQIAEAYAEARSLNADDDTLVMLRKRVGACLIALRADGRVQDVGMVGEHKGWMSESNP